MKQYLTPDEWRIIEEGFYPEHNRVSESIFSIGNGHMGQRANFEEAYSGETLSGSYVAGIYYPDKTKVGWWKIGYPESFAKVLNAPNWMGIDVAFDGEKLDLAKGEVLDFRRELNMREGYLERRCTLRMKSGRRVEIRALRLCSIAEPEVGMVEYRLRPLDFSATLTLTPYVNADVSNQDANWEEKFWVEVNTLVKRRSGYVLAATKKTDFKVCTGMKFTLAINGETPNFTSFKVHREKYVGCTVDLAVNEGDEVTLCKYAAVLTSRDYPEDELLSECRKRVKAAYGKGTAELKREQAEAWAEKWEEADVSITGDLVAQQGIRFNIFQLYQTYTGRDPRLNIGPKGFTGEKYGGGVYWDTEAFCLPFYLATAEPAVARNLLLYRYRQLPQAIDNAQLLGFTDGAALYPMVTMDGTESHNEWEITFEEIHRNGAIAYAIYDYVRYTGDDDYLTDYGLEVLIAIARFWSQRTHWSKRKDRFVLHGVTGPNEYENNVNNNWYTNYLAVWCLRFTLEAIDMVRSADPAQLAALSERLHFHENTETERWRRIIESMYLPEDEELGILVQHEGFLDKEDLTVADLRPEDRPLNRHWSWDRILRSVFIKQADVLMGLYLFEQDFDRLTLQRNFDYYEARTVHESSLSAGVHAILASHLGQWGKAYEFFLRTARLDLDDYNNDTEDGCHITSMAGAWLALVKGFGGLHVREGELHLSPYLPDNWRAYTYTIRFRDRLVTVTVDADGLHLQHDGDEDLPIVLFGDRRKVPVGQEQLFRIVETNAS